MTMSPTFPHLLDPSVEDDPYALYRMLRDHEPLHYDPSAGAVLVTRHADLLAAYRHPGVSTRNYAWQLEPVMGVTLLQLEGAAHSRVRGIMTPYFRGNGLETWLPLIHQNVAAILDGAVARSVETLVQRFVTGQEIDLVADFARYLPVYVIADMLGLPKSDHARFYGWYTTQSEFLSNLARHPAVEARGIEAMHELREYLAPLVAARRAGGGTDLISVLAQAETADGRLLDEEVMTHVTHLLNAGSETTDRTIANLAHHLLAEPGWWSTVRDDRSLVLPAISETLRLTPPSQLNGRLTTTEVELPSGTIPADTFILLVMASANRDERRFERPDVFDPRRADLAHDRAFTSTGEHFAFGHGRHFCLGAMVARSELDTTLQVLLDRFPGMRLADGFVPRSRGIKMRSPTSMRVVL